MLKLRGTQGEEPPFHGFLGIFEVAVFLWANMGVSWANLWANFIGNFPLVSRSWGLWGLRWL